MDTSVLSKGIKVEYKNSSGTSWTEVLNVQSIPDLGGIKESVEITTLADAAHTYRTGLINNGDSLDFTVLYDKTEFNRMKALSGSYQWKVTLPDDPTDPTECTFSGESSVKLNGVGVGGVLVYTLSIKPDSAISF